MLAVGRINVLMCDCVFVKVLLTSWREESYSKKAKEKEKDNVHL